MLPRRNWGCWRNSALCQPHRRAIVAATLFRAMNAAGRGHSKEAAAPGGLAPHKSAYDKKCIRQGERQLSEAASYPRGTAEITTKAWAIGPSSVMVRSMRGSQPAGVIALRRASAP